MTASASGTCAQNCTFLQSSFTTQVLKVGTTASGVAGFKSTAVARWAVGQTQSRWTINFKAPTVTNPVQITNMAPQIRCDNAVPGYAIAGCVIPQVIVGLNYVGGWGGFQSHVVGAQKSGLPGGSAARPIHRSVNAALQVKNRDKACPKTLKRPPGLTCDEYPFASAKEGAFTGGGSARTQPGCQVPFPGKPSTGAIGYSYCMINEAVNSQAGTAMNSKLFIPFRVLDGDGFYVSFSAS